MLNITPTPQVGTEIYHAPQQEKKIKGTNIKNQEKKLFFVNDISSPWNLL